MKSKLLLLVSFMAMAATCGHPAGLQKLPWNNERATADLKVFAEAPHPMGSPRMLWLSDYLEKQMQNEGLTTGRDKWIVQVPDPDLLGQEANPMRSITLPIDLQNIYAKSQAGSDSCAFLIASHYDSKRLLQGAGIGANDSGSSSVALLEIMRGIRTLGKNIVLKCHVVAVWFDGEEAYLPEWRDGEIHHPARTVDNTYGSRHLAESLSPCGKGLCLPKNWGGERVEGLILLDMVGMPDLRLTPELHSDAKMRDLALALDQELFQDQLFSRSSPKSVEDDHIAFLEKGIPSLDLIGFEDLDTWHQPTDTFERVSMESIEKSAQLTAA
ncbi:MAG: Zn-dependent exopeptidase M28, partial [Chitinophagaceae bacterium]|nr:Zn-dependent exopeptidase M28 [Oligoflexus sp.]